MTTHKIQFSFQKLARDKIKKVFDQKGITSSSHVLTGEALLAALKEKLLEEIQEVVTAKTSQELEEEIADVQEVLEALIQKGNLSDDRIAQIRAQKREKFGSFQEGVFFESVQVPEDHQDVAYYRARPEKYPEIGKD
jgi:predicted house-cleaning noncanonical NTP pyrophosphatase (MazG superfamily)